MVRGEKDKWYGEERWSSMDGDTKTFYEGTTVKREGEEEDERGAEVAAVEVG